MLNESRIPEKKTQNEAEDLNNLKILYSNLKNENESIKKEFETLQSQYNEAIFYVSQIDELHKNVSQLTKENLKLINEKDELNQRLQISLKMAEEAKTKIKQQ